MQRRRAIAVLMSVATTAPAAPITDPATTLPEPEPTMFTGDADSEWCVAAAEVEAFDEEFENVASSHRWTSSTNGRCWRRSRRVASA